MNPLILNEPAHETATRTDGKTTRDQDQLLINFLAAKAERRDIGGHSEEASPAEERARAKYVHAEQQLVESGIPETVLKAVTQLRD